MPLCKHKGYSDCKTAALGFHERDRRRTMFNTTTAPKSRHAGGSESCHGGELGGQKRSRERRGPQPAVFPGQAAPELSGGSRLHQTAGIQQSEPGAGDCSADNRAPATAPWRECARPPVYYPPGNSTPSGPCGAEGPLLTPYRTGSVHQRPGASARGIPHQRMAGDPVLTHQTSAFGSGSQTETAHTLLGIRIVIPTC